MTVAARLSRAQSAAEEVADLRNRLREAEETLQAIREGAVDAIIVGGICGEKVFSLDSAERPYRIMIERMNHGAAMLSDSGIILFANAAFATMLRRRLETLPGSDVRDYVAPEMRKVMEDLLQAGGDGGGRRELRLRASDGFDIPVLASVTDMEPVNADSLCLLVTDLTEQHRREAEMEKSHRELRTYAARLQRSNADLEDFAVIASHDLQEPLRKVRAFADAVGSHCNEQVDEVGRDCLERMSAVAGRMSELVKALLEYSRIGNRSQPFTRVNLQQVLKEVVEDLDIAIRESGAKIEVGVLPAIVADKTQMRQAFQNLLANALKYRRGGVAPRIRVESRLLPGDLVEITVSDNGIGFEPHHAETIFRPFQRLVSSAEYSGTGMGLTICRKIVTGHGGEIHATSQAGAGSKFTITLPVVAVQAHTVAL